MLEALARPARRNIVPPPLSGHRHLPVASADWPEYQEEAREYQEEARHPFGGHEQRCQQQWLHRPCVGHEFDSPFWLVVVFTLGEALFSGWMNER
jgi:hypothetical protein